MYKKYFKNCVKKYLPMRKLQKSYQILNIFHISEKHPLVKDTTDCYNFICVPILNGCQYLGLTNNTFTFSLTM